MIPNSGPVKLDYVPKWSEVNYYYGNPDLDKDGGLDRCWLNTQTGWFPLPFPLYASWNRSKEFRYLRLHKLVGNQYIDALAAIAHRVGKDRLHAEGWDILGGALGEPRPMKGTPDHISLHAYGIAVDHNNHIAGWQVHKSDMPPVFVRDCLDVFYEEFTLRGFVSGGDFPEPYVDWMHFQACGM